MTTSGKTWQWTLAVASLAAAAAWSLPWVTEAVDGELRAGYVKLLAGDSATQSVVLVDVGAGGAGPDLAAAIVADGPRLVVDGEGHLGCWLRLADGTCSEAQVPADRDAEAHAAHGGWVRPGGPVFAALAAIGEEPSGPVALRYVRRLPTVPAVRVAAGEIPQGTFSGRVVVVGRADEAALSVTTPLGAMSPAQVEAHALLGVLDGAARSGLPGWLRAAAVAAWAAGAAWALRRGGARALLGWTTGALAIDAVLYAMGVAASVAGMFVVAVMAAAAGWTGLRAAARASAAREDAPAASGLHMSSRPFGPE